MTTPVYKSGSTVPVTVPVPIDSGLSPLAVLSVTVTIHDEAGVALSNLTPDLPESGQDQFTFEIPADKNLLVAGVRKGARQIEVTFETEPGLFVEIAHYVIESNNQLTLLENTFMSYPEALMVRTDLPLLAGWDAATDSERLAALHVAHQAMCNMRFRYRVGSVGSQRRLSDFPGTTEDGVGRIHATISDIRNILLWEWNEMPVDFKSALKRAQIVEADTQLSGDPIGDKRRSGIISETIGESSMFFRAAPDVKYPISLAAMTHLRGYVLHSSRITRG